jgi:hypothetical protein
VTIRDPIGYGIPNTGGAADTEKGVLPKFSNGVLRLTDVFDTDAGATKTYVNGETLTRTIHVFSNASDILLGYPVAAIVKTYNVIA